MTRDWSRIWLCAVPLLFAAATGLAAEPVVIHSRSGQFVIRGLHLGTSTITSTSSVPTLRLDPTVLAVSCERIKAVLLDTLDMRDRWRGTVYLNLRETSNDSIRLISSAYQDGWSYKLELPIEIQPDRLTAAIVEVLLREIVNRRQRVRQTVLPLWLKEGMAGHIQAVAGRDLALELGTRLLRKTSAIDSIARVRRELGYEDLLSLEELAWPGSIDWAIGGKVYKASAQFLVLELLRLKDGPKCMAEMLRLLPGYLNWQTAFSKAFQAYFPAMTDLDKWWALQTVSFSNHGQTFHWDNRTVLQKLGEVLRVQVEVRLSERELPMRTSVKLQQVIREWDYEQQKSTLAQRINHLQALSLRTPPERIGLINRYIETLAFYMSERSRRFRTRDTIQQLVTATLARLDALDGQRRVWERSAAPAVRE